MTEIVQQHVAGARFEVNHACPDCPTPLTQAGKLIVGPSPFCPMCSGTGLVTTQQLAHWQARQGV